MSNSLAAIAFTSTLKEQAEQLHMLRNHVQRFNMAGVLRWIFGKCDESNSDDQFGVEKQEIKSTKNLMQRAERKKRKNLIMMLTIAQIAVQTQIANTSKAAKRSTGYVNYSM